MTHATHTPGPWHKAYHGHIYGANDRRVASIDVGCIYDRGAQSAEEAANARLIAEAPAMLEALRWAKDAMTPANNSEEIKVCSEIAAILARIDGADA